MFRDDTDAEGASTPAVPRRETPPADGVPSGPLAPGAVPHPPHPHAAGIHPELAERLAALEQERIRQEKWRAQVWRERRALLVLLGFVLLCLPNFRMARVVGHSMEPQFHPGDALLVLKSWRWFSSLKPGDIIVFRQDGEELVKRVIFVQNEQNTATWPKTVQTSRGPVSIGPEFFPGAVDQVDRIPSRPGYQRRSVYVMGDNWEISDDSRSFGPIAPETILGKVVMKP